MDSMFARQEALDRGHDDAVMLTTAGNLAEATSSNLFMVKDGEVLTPNVGCAFLPGITREAVIEICLSEGVPCREVMEGPETLMGADEVFLTNSMFELMPVGRVGNRDIPSCPGPVTARLHSAYRDLVDRETPC
jgi:branched-chain amino acid aminotransferase